MDIAVLGTGDVGRTLAAAFAAAGHDVTIGSRSPDDPELTSWSEEAGVRRASSRDAAGQAEVVVLATAWDGALPTLDAVGAALDGKVLVDVTNPLVFTDRLGLAIGHDDSGGEQVQRWAPGARVVKAFNTVGWELMDHPEVQGPAPTLFAASDDPDATAVVVTLADDLGWGVHDCGDLRAARLTEPLAMVWIDHALRTGGRDHILTMAATTP